MHVEKEAHAETRRQSETLSSDVITWRDRALKAESDLAAARQSLTTSMAASEKAGLDAQINQEEGKT